MKIKKTLLKILAVIVALLILFLILRGVVESTLGKKIADASALFDKGRISPPSMTRCMSSTPSCAVRTMSCGSC